jgi:hypothetical protein
MKLKKLVKKLDEKNLKIFVFAGLFVATFILVINFIFSDISAWDMPGHFVAADYIKSYLWPWPSGWNNLSLIGFPQGYFYPPLFHWLVALLSFLMPLKVAFKLLIVLALFLIPFSFFYFARSLGLKELDALLAMLCMWFFLIPIKGDIGGDFYSTFVIGLVTAHFAFPFFFFYLGTIVKKGDLRRSIVGGILLAVLILSHSFAALAAIISSLVIGFALRKKINPKYFILHFIIAIGLSAFWIFPFIYFSSFKEGIFVGGVVPPLHPLLFYILLVSIVFLAIKKDTLAKPVLYLATIFVFIIQFFSYFYTIIPHNFPLHLFRFNIFVYCFFGFIIARALCFRPIEKYKKQIIFLLIAFLLVSTFFLSQEIFKFKDRSVEIDINKLPLERGAVITTVNPYKAPHIVWSSLLLKKIPLVNGLFVESSISAKAINTLLLEIWPDSFVWGIEPYPINRENLSDLLEYHLRYLGVCWIISENAIDEKILPKANITKINVKIGNIEKKEYYVYSFDCNLAESIGNLPLRVESKEWQEKVKEWWSDPYKIQRIYIKSDLPISFVEPKKVKIDLIEAKNDYYKFYIHSEKEVPVLIKISYFPNWHAFSDGKPIAIYQASPSLIFVQARGNLELKFVRSKIEIFGLVVSIITLLFCIFAFLKTKLKK